MSRALVAVLAIAVVGCGGAGGIVGFSPYEGTWTGTWTGSVASGPATVKIDAIGTISGTMHSDAINEDGPITGEILNDGTTTITVTFPSKSPVTGDGKLVISNAGTKLTGTLDFSGDNVAYDLSR